MKEALNHNIDYEKLKNAIVEKLKNANGENSGHRVGFVSGIILSDGPMLTPRNLGYLGRYTKFIKRHVDYPVFSAIDLLMNVDRKMALNLIKMESSKGDSKRFWKEILESGFITDVFMTPRWLNSSGAKNEYQTAVEKGLTIHHLKWKRPKQ